MGRTILAVIAGAIVMWLTIFALEFVGQALFPPPAGLDPKDPAQLAQVIAQMPAGAMAMLVVAWVAGAFTGGFTAARLSQRHPRGVAAFVALLVMAGVAGMIYLVPDHPMWVSALGLALPIPVALLAARLARPAAGAVSKPIA
jgi:pimeloyl-ACP methyl ester carboxylesterase